MNKKATQLKALLMKSKLSEIDRQLLRELLIHIGEVHLVRLTAEEATDEERTLVDGVSYARVKELFQLVYTMWKRRVRIKRITSYTEYVAAAKMCFSLFAAGHLAEQLMSCGADKDIMYKPSIWTPAEIKDLTRSYRTNASKETQKTFALFTKSGFDKYFLELKAARLFSRWKTARFWPRAFHELLGKTLDQE